MLGTTDAFSSCSLSPSSGYYCGWDGERPCAASPSCESGTSYDNGLATCQLPSLSCATPAHVDSSVPLDITFLVATDIHAGSDAMPVANFQTNAMLMNLTNAQANGRSKIPGIDLRWPTYYRSGAQMMEDPVAVVLTGDMVHNGFGWEWGILRTFYEPELYSSDRSNELRIPVYPGLGNHDALTSCSSGCDCTTPNDCTARYENYMDQRVGNCPLAYSYDASSKNYSWNWNNVHLIQLNTWAGDDRGARTSGAGLSWLANDLAQVGSRPVIIFQHYGFDGFSDEDQWWTADERAAFYEVIASSNVIAFFVGHLHEAQEMFWNGFKVYQGSHGGRTDESDAPGIFAVHLTDDYLDVEHYTWQRGALSPMLGFGHAGSSRGRIRFGGHPASCLDVTRSMASPPAPFASGEGVQLWSCAGREVNQFFQLDGGFDLNATSIRIGADPSNNELCLAEPTAGDVPTLQPCSSPAGQPITVAGQSWSVYGSTIRSWSGRCLTAAKADNGTPVLLAACDGSARQRWQVEHNRAALWSWYFADSMAPWASPAYADTLRLADIDGDGKADVCARSPDGLYCGLATTDAWGRSSFTTPKRVSSGNDFMDAFWNSAANRMQLGNVDGDTSRRSDVCVRMVSGVYCAVAAAGGTFGPLQLWTSQFGDDDCVGGACWGAALYADTLRLADVNGDGKADLCGRISDGIECALSTGIGFAPRTRWSSGLDFSDRLGFNVPWLSAPLFGNVDGDSNRYADVCMRYINGVECALSTGSGFAAATLWTTDYAMATGWTNPAYVDSLRLADFQKSGRLGLCGRNGSGVVCSASSGSAFGPSQVLSSAFSDAYGWSAQQSYYDTVQLADVDGDGFADACGRSADGILCAITPR
jgi:cytolysin (calcineurin-like family phosphatase)